ncbi:MAG: hypothetical protein LBR25_05695 [Erysipelotrichaceae bacterium]|jgi:hypothetical protein|nr:hypothetical protein [Erysipelotrichaceae bacterium]
MSFFKPWLSKNPDRAIDALRKNNKPKNFVEVLSHPDTPDKVFDYALKYTDDFSRTLYIQEKSRPLSRRLQAIKHISKESQRLDVLLLFIMQGNEEERQKALPLLLGNCTDIDKIKELHYPDETLIAYANSTGNSKATRILATMCINEQDKALEILKNFATNGTVEDRTAALAALESKPNQEGFLAEIVHSLIQALQKEHEYDSASILYRFYQNTKNSKLKDEIAVHLPKILIKLSKNNSESKQKEALLELLEMPDQREAILEIIRLHGTQLKTNHSTDAAQLLYWLNKTAKDEEIRKAISLYNGAIYNLKTIKREIEVEEVTDCYAPENACGGNVIRKEIITETTNDTFHV